MVSFKWLRIIEIFQILINSGNLVYELETFDENWSKWKLTAIEYSCISTVGMQLFPLEELNKIFRIYRWIVCMHVYNNKNQRVNGFHIKYLLIVQNTSIVTLTMTFFFGKLISLANFLKLSFFSKITSKRVSKVKSGKTQNCWSWPIVNRK